MDREQVVIYCAGFFDGDGCISFEKVQQRPDASWEYRLRCIINQKFHDEPLHLFLRTFGGRLHFDGNRTTHLINGRDAVAMLTELLPFLTVKRDQAEIAVRFFEMTGFEREAAFQEVRKLKRAYKFLDS